MSSLNNDHYKTILKFSQFISKGVNADDLSQHVILRLLSDVNLLPSDVMTKPKALRVWLYRFILTEYSLSRSTFNRLINLGYNKGSEVIEAELSDELMTNNIDVVDHSIDVYQLISDAKITDKERMYLNAYIDNDSNYRKCSRALGIHFSTISIHVNRTLKKCRDTI